MLYSNIYILISQNCNVFSQYDINSVIKGFFFSKQNIFYSWDMNEVYDVK